MTTNEEMIRRTEQVTAHNYLPLPVVIARGVGPWVYDVQDQRYLDCISAYSSLNQGHCHPRLLEALQAQAERLTLTSRAVHNDRMGPFLEKLCGLADFSAALPMNTGAEAVETAIKLARKWGYLRKGVSPNRARIIVCRNNFHGRTTTIVGFSTEPQYRDGFGPYDDSFDVVDFDNSDALEAAIGPDTVAFMVEPIQAEAGIHVPSDRYLDDVRALCTRHGILMMLDEIQTGLGRTGKLFAYEHAVDAKPDVLILGKALGGGVYPVSAVLAARDIMDVFEPGDHGSTFGGNPLAAAVGEAALDVIIDEQLAARAETLGNHLRTGIIEFESEQIREVRGRGLLLGIELRSTAGTAGALAKKLLQHGVLTKDTHRQVLRIAPPLVIERSDVDWLLTQLRLTLC